MLTSNDIEGAFMFTCQYHNGHTIEQCLNDEHGELLNTIYAIAEQLSQISNFSCILIHSDGGVKDFFLTYQMRDYAVLAGRYKFPLYAFGPKNPEELAEYFNNIERKIKASATLAFLD